MILYGASGHAKVIIDILKSQGLIPEFIVDDNPDINSLLDFEVRRNLGKYDKAIISIGQNEIRKFITEKIEVHKYMTAIHSSAIISEHSNIGDGTVVMPGAIVQSDANIGKHCIINTAAIVDHECLVGAFAHVSVNSLLCGNVQVGEGSFIGAGSVVLPGIKIGAWSIIGAGSVVTKDIPDSVIAFGNQCKIIKTR